MSAETIVGLWKDVRKGLIEEVEKIPDDKFSFRATPETRSVAEILQHIIESQKILVGEACRAESNLGRQSFPAHIAEYAAGVRDVSDKNGLLDLLRSSMDDAKACLKSYSGTMDDSVIGITGQPTTKGGFLTFALSHEMYHRGQLTVFERLLDIEPELTVKFKKYFAQAG